MKVIKEGKIPTPIEDRTYTHTCSKCSTEFEFEGKEAENIGCNFKIPCPICKEDCWIMHTATSGYITSNPLTMPSHWFPRYPGDYGGPYWTDCNKTFCYNTDDVPQYTDPNISKDSRN